MADDEEDKDDIVLLLRLFFGCEEDNGDGPFGLILIYYVYTYLYKCVVCEFALQENTL
jgi:hypothetical protein